MAEKAKKKTEKNKSGGKNAPLFYCFRLSTHQRLGGEHVWKFEPVKTQLFPFIEDQIKLATTQTINYKGLLSQCTVKNAHTMGDIRVMEIVVKNYLSQNPNIKKDV